MTHDGARAAQNTAVHSFAHDEVGFATNASRFAVRDLLFCGVAGFVVRRFAVCTSGLPGSLLFLQQFELRDRLQLGLELLSHALLLGYLYEYFSRKR